MINYQPKYSLETAPVAEPISVADAKTFLRVDGSDEDGIIGNLITAVRVQAENYLRRRLISQSWKVAFDGTAPAAVHLPYLPAQSVTSVTLKTRAGIETVMDSERYYLTAGNEVLMFDTYLCSHLIEVVYVAGYGDSSSDVPEPIRQGMLQQIGYFYEGRGNNGNMPVPVKSLWEPYRINWL